MSLIGVIFGVSSVFLDGPQKVFESESLYSVS